jgi:hypothetical protein
LKRGLDIVRLTFVAVLVLAIALTAGCAEGNKTKVTETNGGEGASRDSRPVVLVPRADGTLIFEGTSSLIDASHLEDGYVMVKYTGDGRIKMQLTHDDQEPYTYDLPTSGVFQTFPLTSGNGHYTLNIYRNISGDKYAFVDGASFDVILKNEFTPFLHPSQYVDYTEETAAVAHSEVLAQGASDDLDVVKRIYYYVVNNIVYDMDKAKNVPSGIKSLSTALPFPERKNLFLSLMKSSFSFSDTVKSLQLLSTLKLPSVAVKISRSTR